VKKSVDLAHKIMRVNIQYHDSLALSIDFPIFFALFFSYAPKEAIRPPIVAQNACSNGAWQVQCPCLCYRRCRKKTMVKPTNLPIQFVQHAITRPLRGWILGALLAVMLLWSSGDVANARHGPTHHDRRPDRETRIRYPRTPRTTQNPPSGTLHSAPATSTPAPTATPE
jgi:hypothetical protein